jgi:hypothetical protein
MTLRRAAAKWSKQHIVTPAGNASRLEDSARMNWFFLFSFPGALVWRILGYKRRPQELLAERVSHGSVLSPANRYHTILLSKVVFIDIGSVPSVSDPAPQTSFELDLSRICYWRG